MLHERVVGPFLGPSRESSGFSGKSLRETKKFEEDANIMSYVPYIKKELVALKGQNSDFIFIRLMIHHYSANVFRQ